MCRILKWHVIQLNLEIAYLWEEMDFCLLLKIWVEILAKMWVKF